MDAMWIVLYCTTLNGCNTRGLPRALIVKKLLCCTMHVRICRVKLGESKELGSSIDYVFSWIDYFVRMDELLFVLTRVVRCVCVQVIFLCAVDKSYPSRTVLHRMCGFFWQGQYFSTYCSNISVHTYFLPEWNNVVFFSFFGLTRHTEAPGVV